MRRFRQINCRTLKSQKLVIDLFNFQQPRWYRAWKKFEKKILTIQANLKMLRCIHVTWSNVQAKCYKHTTRGSTINISKLTFIIIIIIKKNKNIIH